MYSEVWAKPEENEKNGQEESQRNMYGI